MDKLKLLDYFAAKAMIGLLGNLAIADKELAIKQREYWVEMYGGDIKEVDAIAKESYLIAKAMLKERENQKM